MNLPEKRSSRHWLGQPAGLIDLLVAGVWLGLMSGILEGLLYLTFQHLGFLEWDEALLSVGPQQMFVSAVANASLLVILAAPVALVGARTTWKHWPHVTLGLLVFLSFLPLLDLSGRIQMRASLILALGLTVQTVRWMAPRQATVLALMRRTLWPLAGATALAGLAVWVGGPIVEQVQANRLPQAPASPNLLLIVLDTVRADHLSSYGYDRPTSPNLDALAAQGIQFDHAYATSSWTLPTLASLMTGLLPSEHGATVRRNRSPLRAELPVLSETMNARGYRTAGFVANTTWLTPWMGLTRGFLHYESSYFSVWDAMRRSYYGRQASRRILGRLGLSAEVRPSAPQLNAALLRWLDGNPGRPFFVFLNYMEAHTPNPVPQTVKSRFKGASPSSRSRIRKEQLAPDKTAQREEWIGEYDTALSYLDSRLGEMFAELRQRGLFENTLILVTSDHGESFGRHQLFDHGHSLYEEVIHVPLILRLPGGVHAGRKVPQRVSLRDVPATALGVLGFERHRLGGSSLAESWSSPSTPARPVIAEVNGAPFPGVPENWPVRQGWVKSITIENWKLILQENGSLELYDLAVDQLERNNLAMHPEQRIRVQHLRNALREHLAATSNPAASD